MKPNKKHAYEAGCRPVLYLSDEETDKTLHIPEAELWRVCRFEELAEGEWMSWIHEREWRCKGDFQLTTLPVGVVVKTHDEVSELNDLLSKTPDDFNCKPRSILPLKIICQGLNYLDQNKPK
jgi:hypothetical protein